VIKRIVLASSNPGKVRELEAILEGDGIEVVAQGVLGIEAADETYATFVENALAKARHAATSTGLPALADDSGLCVDALDGAPGIWSARFAGEPADDERNNRELLQRLAAVTSRRAHYTCVLVAVRAPDDPEPLIVDARWHGEIARASRGKSGFGYDPLFFVPQLGMTAAELDPAHKNRISHRGLAVAALAVKLPGWFQ
jgi:XTP/dITP diphosphohydrolase